ncbi:hypothetical protein DPMN_168454 [Dreissena polymorpha]|uniref:Uncharacterized protein n=1 Tax=Dreissena polymorpha TaxID=45954 RepID=A0A9D4F1T8_DREPO|nr:hypothetical protein DPMN_168454 [Dreissena polymorpha]
MAVCLGVTGVQGWGCVIWFDGGGLREYEMCMWVGLVCRGVEIKNVCDGVLGWDCKMGKVGRRCADWSVAGRWLGHGL